mmetsp:Transcript_37015/g.104426  ORF Transcript_37015/g.104426 Transcript_37015/m.104426 type:complete len:464 (+) Transcript_37015:578-1969(+)
MPPMGSGSWPGASLRAAASSGSLRPLLGGRARPRGRRPPAPHQAILCTRWRPCSETAMSLNCPGISTSTTSLKPAPIKPLSSGVSQPRSPHVLPPLRAVSHSECSLQSSVNFFPVMLTSSVASFGAFWNALTSFRISLMTLRSNASASWRVRDIFFPLETTPPSLYLTRMWRSRTLCVPPPGAAMILVFFACGGASMPAALGPRFLSSPPEWTGRKQTSTAVHCAVAAAPARTSRARWAISPQAARGCVWNSLAISTSWCGPSTTAMEDAARSRKGCSPELLSAMPCTSGVLRTIGRPTPLPRTSFQNRSPKDRLTGDRTPAGCCMQRPLSSLTIMQPKSRSRSASVGARPLALPSGTGVQRSPSWTSHRTAPQRPSTAVKTWLPMRRATAAPHPSLMSGWFWRSSWSRSANVPRSASSTECSSGSGGSLESRSKSFTWKLRAQNSAAWGPGVPAHDCPSNTA